MRKETAPNVCLGRMRACEGRGKGHFTVEQNKQPSSEGLRPAASHWAVNLDHIFTFIVTQSIHSGNPDFYKSIL